MELHLKVLHALQIFSYYNRTMIHATRGLYIGKYPPPLGGGEGKISADVIWGKKHEKAKRKRGKL
jgi:hypothetical protein